MSPDKPSKTEEEYFTKREMELLRQKREAARSEAEQAARKQHYMKCPKCGADLAEEEVHGVVVDRCPDDNGIWLDAGELELLLDEKKPGLLAKVFSGVAASLSERNPE